MHNQLKPCHCFLTAHKYHKKYVRCFLKNQQLCETHTYHGKHQCLLEAVEGDAEGLQLHPAVVWVCSSCRSDPVPLTLGTVTPGEVPGVGACWKGALEGPGALLPLCCQSSQASFCQLRSGFWWAACAGCSAAVGTACRPSPWPSCCAGGQTSQLHTPCSSCPTEYGSFPKDYLQASLPLAQHQMQAKQNLCMQ